MLSQGDFSVFQLGLKRWCRLRSQRALKCSAIKSKNILQDAMEFLQETQVLIFMRCSQVARDDGAKGHFEERFGPKNISKA